MSKKDFSATPQRATITYGHAAEPELRLLASSEVEAPSSEHPAEPCVAVLVCHGMGEQVRYETIGQVAASILAEASRQGCVIETNGVQMSLEGGDFLARAELNWTDPAKVKHNVHVYEAYWAPITEGKVTYYDTLLFLVQAAWSGIRRSRLLRVAFFDRWMFGSMQTALKIGRATLIALLGVLVLLLGQALLIATTLAKLASQLKQVGASRFAIKQALIILFPGSNALCSHWITLLVWIVIVAEVFVARYFLIEYVGDVAAYISPYKDSKFDSIRHQIQAIGLNVAKVIYGFTDTTAVPNYDRVVVVGHSLGSVIAYDTLNAINICDKTSATPGSQRVVNRTKHLITFGSPLDKTAFLFRNQTNHIHDPLREQMAAASQPLILDYEYREHLTWTNLWSRSDIISGSLDYYDADNVAPNNRLHVQNEQVRGAWNPISAHEQYWTGRPLAQLLYKAVS